MRISLLVATATVLLTIVPAANAAVFRGSTAQGDRVTLQTDGEGVPTRLWFKKVKVGCRTDGYRYIDRGSGFFRPFDTATSTRLVDKGPPLEYRSHGLDYWVLGSVRAQQVSPNRWTGRHNLRVRVSDGNDVVERCSGSFSFGIKLTRK
jgi:hypothetical protein